MIDQGGDAGDQGSGAGDDEDPAVDPPDPQPAAPPPASTSPPGHDLSAPARNRFIDIQQLIAGFLSGLLVLLFPRVLDLGNYLATWSWWQWSVTILSIALGVALLRGAYLLVRGEAPPLWLWSLLAALLAALLGLTVLVPLLSPNDPPCGAAEIAVDALLQSQVQTELAKYQDESPHGRTGNDGESITCADSLRVVGIDAAIDLRVSLGSSGTPITAVITSNPEISGGLNPQSSADSDRVWQNLEVGAAATPSWHVIGLDTATVYLPDSEHPFHQQIRFDRVGLLHARATTPADPVAVQVFTAMGGKPTRGLDVRPVALQAGKACPVNVILPASWNPPCLGDRAQRAALVNATGNYIGAPVLGIPLQVLKAGAARSQSARTGPTDAAHRTSQDFLSWLEGRHNDLGLKNLLDSAPRILQAGEHLPALSGRRPLQLGIVLDGSLSMGRVANGGDFGATAPWGPTVGGLADWIGGERHEPGDRFTIVLAQQGRGRVRPRQISLQALPGADPEAETGLAAALAKVSSWPGASAAAGQRRLTVLLTDGVNVFAEKPGAELKGLAVIVVGNARGCAVVPAVLRPRCVTADAEAGDVATQLTTLVGS